MALCYIVKMNGRTTNDDYAVSNFADRLKFNQGKTPTVVCNNVGKLIPTTSAAARALPLSEASL